MTWQIWSVLPVWVATIVAAVLIGTTAAPDERIQWIGITFGAAIVASFVIQLAIQKKEGFVLRTIASIGGAVLVLAVTTGVFALL